MPRSSRKLNFRAAAFRRRTPEPGGPPSSVPAPTPPDRRRFDFRWSYALIIFLLALGYRGLYLYEASHKPDFNIFYMDQEYHLGWAGSLASGEWSSPYDRLREAPYFRAPLYPYFLATLLKLFGESTLFIRIVQAVIGSISCVLAYGVAARCFGQRVGGITGVLCALYWVLAYFDGELLLPVLLVFLVLLGFLLAFLAAERRSVWLAAASGLVFGLYAITRPNVLVFFPVAVLWTARAARDRVGRRPVWFVILFAVGGVLPPTLVTVRNRLVGGDWVAVASQGGVNFYIGNNPESNGMQAVVPGTRQTWWGGYEDTVAIAQQAADRALKPSEVSRYWFGRAFAYIRAQPGHWVRLTLRKALALVGDVELVNNEPYEARRRDYWTLSAIPLSFGLVVGLFVVAVPRMLSASSGADRGFASDAGMRRGFAALVLQFMLVYALSVIAFFVTGRYRVPLVPFVMMGAALSLTWLGSLLQARRFAPAAGLAAVMVLLVGLSMVDHFDARRSARGFAELTDAQDRLALGDMDGAIERLENIRAQRSVRAPEVYVALVHAYFQRNKPGDMPTIAAVVREGLNEYPENLQLLWYNVLCHAEPGMERSIERAVGRYLDRAPDDLRALNLAFNLALRLGEPEAARRHLARAEAVDPHDPRVAKMRAKVSARDTEPAENRKPKGN